VESEWGDSSDDFPPCPAASFAVEDDCKPSELDWPPSFFALRPIVSLFRNSASKKRTSPASQQEILRKRDFNVAHPGPPHQPKTSTVAYCQANGNTKLLSCQSTSTCYHRDIITRVRSISTDTTEDDAVNCVESVDYVGRPASAITWKYKINVNADLIHVYNNYIYLFIEADWHIAISTRSRFKISRNKCYTRKHIIGIQSCILLLWPIMHKSICYWCALGV